MPQRVTTVDPQTIGSGATVWDLIRVPWWFFVILLFFRWWIRHWRFTICFIFFCWAWIAWDFIWWGAILLTFGALSGGMFLWLVVMMRECRWCGWRHLFASIWRLIKVKYCWSRACYVAGFGGDRRRGGEVPKMRFLTVTEFGIKGRVNSGKKLGIPIQQLETSGVMESLKASMAATTVRVQKRHAGLGWVEIAWQDALTVRDVTPRQIDVKAAVLDGWKRIVFGMDDESKPVTIAPDRSLLVVGESGSGKSSIVWALVRGLQRARAPHKLHVLDPKGGVELSQLDGYEYTASYAKSVADAEQIIQDLCSAMFKTYARMDREGIRKVRVSRDYPLNILLIDELLLMKKILSEGVDGPLGKLLTQGRAAGFAVWACSQLPQKDVIGPLRDLFVQRVCLAVRSASMTDAVLGDGAERDGARCSEIELTTPGVGYMYAEGQMGYRRFRSVYIDDSEIVNITGVGFEVQTLELPTVTFEPEVKMLELEV